MLTISSIDVVIFTVSDVARLDWPSRTDSKGSIREEVNFRGRPGSKTTTFRSIPLTCFYLLLWGNFSSDQSNYKTQKNRFCSFLVYRYPWWRYANIPNFFALRPIFQILRGFEISPPRGYPQIFGRP